MFSHFSRGFPVRADAVVCRAFIKVLHIMCLCMKTCTNLRLCCIHYNATRRSLAHAQQA